MALIIHGRTPCAICGDTDLSRPYTATSGVAFAPDHALYEYCDAPLHLSCVEAWPERESFSRGYFDARRSTASQGYGLIPAEGRGWMLACGPAAASDTPRFAEVLLRDWPVRLYSRWSDWAAFVDGAYAEGLEGGARTAAEAAVLELRTYACDLDMLARLRLEAMRSGPT